MQYENQAIGWLLKQTPTLYFIGVVELYELTLY